MALLAGLSACGSDNPEGSAASDPAPSSTPTPAAPPGALLLDFDSIPGLDAGRTVSEVTASGGVGAEVRVATSGAAALESAKGPDGSGAVRFPAYTGTTTSPAVALVVNAVTPGRLDPDDDDFEFGASFKLDARSSGSEADDGDNLVQRGAYDSPGQFKIQLDHRMLSCRILGDDGEIFVKADELVGPGVWYSASCEREGEEVSLALTRLDGDGDSRTWQGFGPTGVVAVGGFPLSVGGKVSPDGVPVASADQFNGVVDDVFLTLG